MNFNLPLELLKTYKPERSEPADCDAFWEQTLSWTRSFPLAAHFEEVETGFSLIEVFDVTFSGYSGHPIKGWLNIPRQREAQLPCVVEYIGYGSGRGLPCDWLLWSLVGYAHLVMDTRGQGSVSLKGDTPDSEPDGGHPQSSGVMTPGILKPETYYYRRLFTDAVRAVEAARHHPAVDADRLAVAGGSQGGGIALAVSGLVSDLAAVLPDVPLPCHYRRALDLVHSDPYQEISRFVLAHPDKAETIFDTLAYFDGVKFAPGACAPALFSVGLKDEISPPSTVFAAYNRYSRNKDIRIWPYNHFECGGSLQTMEKVRFLEQLWN